MNGKNDRMALCKQCPNSTSFEQTDRYGVRYCRRYQKKCRDAMALCPVFQQFRDIKNAVRRATRKMVMAGPKTMTVRVKLERRKA